MDPQRFRTSLVSEPFYSKLCNPRWTHNPDEFALEMRVDVERLRMENFLSQSAPRPQCDPSPRRLPAIGTESVDPRVSRAETSTETEEIVLLHASVDVFLRFNCSSPEQECILLQPGVGVDNKKDQPSTSQQVTAREEFARPTKKRQQQRMTAWTTEQSKQFDRGRSTVKPLLFWREKCLVAHTVCSFFLVSVCFLLYFFSVMYAIFRSRYERRWERLGCTRCMNCCTRTGACIVISVCVNEGCSRHHFVLLASL